MTRELQTIARPSQPFTPAPIPFRVFNVWIGDPERRAMRFSAC